MKANDNTRFSPNGYKTMPNKSSHLFHIWLYLHLSLFQYWAWKVQNRKSPSQNVHFKLNCYFGLLTHCKADNFTSLQKPKWKIGFIPFRKIISITFIFVAEDRALKLVSLFQALGSLPATSCILTCSRMDANHAFPFKIKEC